MGKKKNKQKFGDLLLHTESAIEWDDLSPSQKETHS